MPSPARIVVSPRRLAAVAAAESQPAAVDGTALDGVFADGPPAGADVVVATLANDVATYRALDRELAREGVERADLAWAEVVERVAALEDALGAEAKTDGAADVAAARAAFVRLYEAGLLQRDDRVVDRCPRCATVVDPEDVEPVAFEGELLTLDIPLVDGGRISVELHAVELLPGVAAIAVPATDERVGREAIIPLNGDVVPIVASTALAPRAIVPWHDAADRELAWSAGLTGRAVLDGDGLVVAEGPLAGVSRFAAREAARRMLEAEGVVLLAVPFVEGAGRCRWCGTVVVPIRSDAWYVHIGPLEVDAVDAIRNGTIDMVPPGASDALFDVAGRHPYWCVTTELPSEVLAPVTVCADCGQPTVGLDPSSSCRKCMGPMEGGRVSLAARFVGAMWGVVHAGDAGDGGAWAVSTGGDLGPWCLRATALGIYLTGRPPFDRVVVT